MGTSFSRPNNSSVTFNYTANISPTETTNYFIPADWFAVIDESSKFEYHRYWMRCIDIDFNLVKRELKRLKRHKVKRMSICTSFNCDWWVCFCKKKSLVFPIMTFWTLILSLAYLYIFIVNNQHGTFFVCHSLNTPAANPSIICRLKSEACFTNR
jgi:hypothetical protein